MITAIGIGIGKKIGENIKMLGNIKIRTKDINYDFEIYNDLSYIKCIHDDSRSKEYPLHCEVWYNKTNDDDPEKMRIKKKHFSISRLICNHLVHKTLYSGALYDQEMEGSGKFRKRFDDWEKEFRKSRIAGLHPTMGKDHENMIMTEDKEGNVEIEPTYKDHRLSCVLRKDKLYSDKRFVCAAYDPEKMKIKEEGGK